MNTKIAIMSDLHTDISRYDYDYTLDCDVVVVAGDSKEGGSIEALWPYVNAGKRVIYLMGNHEYYRHEINQTRLDIRNLGTKYGVDVLDRNYVVINGVRFVGCTLWTDFRAYGLEQECMAHAAARMNDYYSIECNDSPSGMLTPQITQQLHFDDRAWLVSVLSEVFDGPTVVTTHHAPCTLSVAPRFKKGVNYHLNAAYASDLTDVMDKFNPCLWIHGHTHDSYDYQVYNTRVVCNPRGYTSHGENYDWKPIVVEV
jgi:predicted phosphodiesterase